MNITFSESAEIKLKQLQKEHNVDEVFYVMDYVDGDSPFYDGGIGCHCQVYDKYHLVVLKREQEDSLHQKYDVCLDTNLGKVYAASRYEMMFDHNNVIDYSVDKYGFYLKSEAGIISMQVTVDFIE